MSFVVNGLYGNGVIYLLDTGRKLNVNKTFRRRPGYLTYVQFTSFIQLVGDTRENAIKEKRKFSVDIWPYSNWIISQKVVDIFLFLVPNLPWILGVFGWTHLVKWQRLVRRGKNNWKDLCWISQNWSIVSLMKREQMD